MYDLDGNGELDLDEMTKIVQDIYTMQKVYAKLGAEYEKPEKSAVETAKVKFPPYFNFSFTFSQWFQSYLLIFKSTYQQKVKKN